MERKGLQASIGGTEERCRGSTCQRVHLRTRGYLTLVAAAAATPDDPCTFEISLLPLFQGLNFMAYLENKLSDNLK